MNGHCDHCDANCSRVVGKRRDHVGQRNEAEWSDRRCPACAVREQIVDAIEAVRDGVADNAYRTGLNAAAEIARGEA